MAYWQDENIDDLEDPSDTKDSPEKTKGFLKKIYHFYTEPKLLSKAKVFEFYPSPQVLEDITPINKQ